VGIDGWGGVGGCIAGDGATGEGIDAWGGVSREKAIRFVRSILRCMVVALTFDLVP
jgi:hypothetical protein